MTPAPDEVALYERGAGLVIPEESVAAHLALAARSGAELHFTEPVTSWQATGGGGVRVSTAAATYTAGQVVICPGAWAPELLADLGVPFGVERQVQYWFAPSGDADRFARNGTRSTSGRPARAASSTASSHPIALFHPRRLTPSAS